MFEGAYLAYQDLMIEICPGIALLRKHPGKMQIAFHLCVWTYNGEGPHNFLHLIWNFISIIGAAGVVVSCKIPILATRVRFPGGAVLNFYKNFYIDILIETVKKRQPQWSSTSQLKSADPGNMGRKSCWYQSRDTATTFCHYPLDQLSSNRQ